MDIQRLLTGSSSKIIIQLGAVAVVVIALIALNFDLVFPFYFENQLTNIGIIINGAIVALLLLGLASILYHLLRYRREEAAIAIFVNNAEALKSDLLEGLPADSIVARRQMTMRSIQKVNGEINHGALAAMLNADEATRFGLIRFINNILILTGVFGTIVSLSISLIGASDLIDSADASLGGMGLVIHGMSTALSTTITAIVSYVYPAQRRANPLPERHRTPDIGVPAAAIRQDRRRHRPPHGRADQIGHPRGRQVARHPGYLP
jgi:hypothetical protein